MDSAEVWFAKWDLWAQWIAAISAAIAALGAMLAVIFTYLAWRGQKKILDATHQQIEEARSQTIEARRQTDLAQAQADKEQLQLEIAEERRNVDRIYHEQRRRSETPRLSYIPYSSQTGFQTIRGFVRPHQMAGFDNPALVRAWFDRKEMWRMIIANENPTKKFRSVRVSTQGQEVRFEEGFYEPNKEGLMVGWLLTMPDLGSTGSDIIFNFETEEGFVDRQVYQLLVSVNPAGSGTVTFERIDPKGPGKN